MNDKDYLLFDEYQRYATISQLINFHRKNAPEKVFKILELGSNEHKDLSFFLTEDKILFTDIELTEKMRDDSDFMEVDGTSVPFENDEFDFVISSDVLEHVPPKKRIAFISEAARVSRIGAILCFPDNTEEVKNTELRVNAYYKAINGIDHYWLNEHIQNGLPDRNEIDEFLKENKLNFYSFTIGSLEIWEKMWYCCFDSLMSDMWEYKTLIDNYYNKNIYPYDIGDNCYRVFYVISKNNTDLWQKFSCSLFKKSTNNSLEFLDTLIQKHYNSYTLANLKSSYLGINSNVRWNNNPKVFPDYGESYSETTKIVCTDFDFRYGVLNTKVVFPKSPLRIRFDPVDCLYCLVSEIRVMANNTELPIACHNGIDFNGVLLFDTLDSNIYYENTSGANEFYITAKISAFNDINLLNALKQALGEKSKVLEYDALKEKAEEIYNQNLQSQTQLAAANTRLTDTENRLENLQNQLNTTQNQLTESQTQLAAANTRLSDKENSLGELQNQLNTTQNQLTESQTQLAAANARLSDTENRLENLQNQLNTTQNQLTESQTQLAAANTRLSDTENRLENLQNQFNTTQNRLTESQTQLTAANARLSDTENRLGELQNQLNTTQNQLTESQNQTAAAQEQLTAALSQLSASQEQLIVWQDKYSALEIQYSDSRERVFSLKNLISEREAKLKDLETELEKEKAENLRISSELNKANAENQQWKSEYDSISNSRFWKITYPFRRVFDLLKSLFKKKM